MLWYQVRFWVEWLGTVCVSCLCWCGNSCWLCGGGSVAFLQMWMSARRTPTDALRMKSAETSKERMTANLAALSDSSSIQFSPSVEVCFSNCALSKPFFYPGILNYLLGKKGRVY